MPSVREAFVATWRYLSCLSRQISTASLFNASLESRMIPSEWKAANITPVPKGANRELVKNYRPISVLPIVAIKSLKQ